MVRALATIAQCQARLRVQQTANLSSWASAPGTGNAAAGALVRAVGRASRITPRATCLVRALALQRLLSQNGLASELRIGVSKNANQFSAHAWLIHDNKILIGGDEDTDEMRILTTWSASGSPLKEQAR
ncbi:MAG: lasso peptide biosynthesis B2 protein [Hyphomicrobiaceae bacterium]|nr:lasso peptide biosynthesis B2 protein [Hyphomicrobiaceae bacterium]